MKLATTGHEMCTPWTSRSDAAADNNAVNRAQRCSCLRFRASPGFWNDGCLSLRCRDEQTAEGGGYEENSKRKPHENWRDCLDLSGAGSERPCSGQHDDHRCLGKVLCVSQCGVQLSMFLIVWLYI